MFFICAGQSTVSCRSLLNGKFCFQTNFNIFHCFTHTLQKMFGTVTFFVLSVFYHTTNASVASRTEDLLTTTQPSNGVLDASMPDVNLNSHLEANEKHTKSFLQVVIEYFCFAFIMLLLLVFICCSIVALILKTRAYIAKKFNK